MKKDRSFRRIIDIPFETWVDALENWQRMERDGELRIGQSLLRGPIEHDRDSGTRRIEVRLARGPLRPLLRMRLTIDRWSWLPERTAIELIPCDRVRPAAAYFRSGHLLLDSLVHSVARHTPAQRLDHAACGSGRCRSASGPFGRCERPQRPAGAERVQPGGICGLITGPQTQVQPVLDDLAPGMPGFSDGGGGAGR